MIKRCAIQFLILGGMYTNTSAQVSLDSLFKGLGNQAQQPAAVPTAPGAPGAYPQQQQQQPNNNQAMNAGINILGQLLQQQIQKSQQPAQQQQQTTGSDATAALGPKGSWHVFQNGNWRPISQYDRFDNMDVALLIHGLMGDKNQMLKLAIWLSNLPANQSSFSSSSSTYGNNYSNSNVLKPLGSTSPSPYGASPYGTPQTPNSSQPTFSTASPGSFAMPNVPLTLPQGIVPNASPIVANPNLRYQAILTFEYPSGIDIQGQNNPNGTIPTIGQEFAMQLARGAREVKSVNIFAHSMGGLIARYALEVNFPVFIQGDPNGFKDIYSKIRLITLGTPHAGVPQDVMAAAFQSLLPGFNTLTQNQQPASGGGGFASAARPTSTPFPTNNQDTNPLGNVFQNLLGGVLGGVTSQITTSMVPATKELAAGSAFLTALNNNPFSYAAQTDYVTIAGTKFTDFQMGIGGLGGDVGTVAQMAYSRLNPNIKTDGLVAEYSAHSQDISKFCTKWASEYQSRIFSIPANHMEIVGFQGTQQFFEQIVGPVLLKAIYLGRTNSSPSSNYNTPSPSTSPYSSSNNYSSSSTQSQPYNPYTPNTPTYPSTPYTPSYPPTQPSTPPRAPSTPTYPPQPSTPSTPTYPSQPSTPPSTPSYPPQPSTPSTPSYPPTPPSTPSTPVQPSAPPRAPSTPTYPSQPSTPSSPPQPSTPTPPQAPSTPQYPPYPSQPPTPPTR